MEYDEDLKIEYIRIGGLRPLMYYGKANIAGTHYAVKAEGDSKEEVTQKLIEEYHAVWPIRPGSKQIKFG